MIPVSQNFKDLTYGRGQYKLFARQFLPSAVLTLVDTDAQRGMAYTATSTAFYSNLRQLYDYGITRTRAWGTLEDYQFLLDGNVMLMPTSTRQLQSQQNGWISEDMSDASGNFTTPEKFNVIFGRMTSTGGHLVTFDPSYDSIPKSFDIVYYRNGTEVQRDEIRDNTAYSYNSEVKADRYNQITIFFYSTSLPYRRVHIIEDMPGIFLNYGEGDIVEMDITQEVDPLSEELVTGEATLGVSNMSRVLDILNGEGLNKYLKQYQRVDMFMELVYPDLTREKVRLGYWNLIDWKASRDMSAVFTLQDPTVAMNRETFRRLPYQEKISLYDLAILIFEDADIQNYWIDTALQNYYCSTAQVPLQTHKECLRLVAQAAHAVVTVANDGQIRVTQLNPLVTGKNLIVNSSFAATSSWTLTNADRVIDYIYSGVASVHPHDNFVISQKVKTVKNHVYYVRAYVYATEQTQESFGSAYMKIDGMPLTDNLMSSALVPGGWSILSGLVKAPATLMTISVEGYLSNPIVYFDSFMCIDLTALYGDAVPTAEWCELNIIYFDGELLLPPLDEQEAVESLDYSTLIESPDILLEDLVSGIYITAKQVQASDQEEPDQLYEETRTVRGTETFFADFQNAANEVTEVIVEGGDLVNYTAYTQSIELTVRAVGDVYILVRGRAVQLNSSTYSRTYENDEGMLPGADPYELQNDLISNVDQVTQLLSYFAYWLQQRYKYMFEWRQDPSIEVMDYLRVQDDFRNDKTILCTVNNLDYGDGVLSGSSEGRGGNARSKKIVASKIGTGIVGIAQVT